MKERLRGAAVVMPSFTNSSTIDATMAAGRDFLSAELPDGWLPAGPDDPLIVAFVDRCLGRAPS